MPWDDDIRGPGGIKYGVWIPRDPNYTKKKEEKAPEQPKAPADDWMKIKVVDDESGVAIAKVALNLKTPDGNTEQHTTRIAGEIESLGIQSGNCEVSCDLKDATLENTLSFVGVAEKPIGQKSETSFEPGNLPSIKIATIEEHKVKTGETIESLAKSAGMTWQDLAKFNWGTDKPEEINKHLASDVGCTKKTADGKNYLFDKADDPGIIYIPKKWSTSRCTNQAHTIRVKRVGLGKGITLELKTDDGLEIPEAEYSVIFSDGAEKKGRLNKKGLAKVVPTAPGPFSVTYPDHDDIQAKILAAMMFKELKAKEVEHIIGLLTQPIEVLRKMSEAYDTYFNTLSGNGLIEDINSVAAKTKQNDIIEHLLVLAELKEPDQLTVEMWDSSQLHFDVYQA